MLRHGALPRRQSRRASRTGETIIDNFAQLGTFLGDLGDEVGQHGPLERCQVAHHHGRVAMQRLEIGRGDLHQPSRLHILGNGGIDEEAQALALDRQPPRRAGRQFDAGLRQPHQGRSRFGVGLPPAQRDDAGHEGQHLLDGRGARKARRDLGRHHQRHAFAHHHQRFEVHHQRVDIGPAENAHLHFALVQHGRDLRLPALAHDDVDGGIFLLEPQQAFGDQRRHQRAQRGDGDPPPLHAAERLPSLLRRADDAAGKGQEGHALVRQRHRPPALEELHAEKLLQRADAHRSGGLGDVEMRRRAGEALVADDAVEGAKLVEVHRKGLCERRVSTPYGNIH